MTLSEIEKAITELSPEELNRLQEWLDEYYSEVWDKQIEEDAKAGKLDKIAEEALREFRASKAKEL
jgi:hypothetical protein